MSSVDFSREPLLSLNSDGISDEIYKLLWARDELNYSPSVNIPDTVLYRYGQPITWYFTSSNGQIKKKNKSNLLSAKIEETFTKNILGYDVVAYFITVLNDNEDVDENSKTGESKPTTLIEYFDKESLLAFLYNHKKDVNGILQKFIEPKSTHNEVIRSIWSPKLNLLESIRNIHPLHDTRYGLYEKCILYEGPEYFYTSSPLKGPVLSGKIQKICEEMINHISEVTYGQKLLKRMVLNFKIDSRDKIWFLYSTSMRCVDMLEFNPLTETPNTKKPLLNLEKILSLPSTVSLNPTKSYKKIEKKKMKCCLSCSQSCIETMRHPVQYKILIKHHDYILTLLKQSGEYMYLNEKGKLESFNSTSPSPTHGQSSVHSFESLHSNSYSKNTLNNKKKVLVIPWPPSSEVLDAAGGVGYGSLEAGDKGSTNKKSLTYNSMNQSCKPLHDVEIPPIIGILHPKLTNEIYQKCKNDPLFINKTINICEDCYLVYSEFMLLLIKMGDNIKKLLTPSPSVGVLNTGIGKSSTQFNDGLNMHSMSKPSSDDWKELSQSIGDLNLSYTSVNNSLSRTSPGRMNSSSLRSLQLARDRAVGLRSSDVRVPPSLPSSVRNMDDLASPYYGGLLESDSPYPHKPSTHDSSGFVNPPSLLNTFSTTDFGSAPQLYLVEETSPSKRASSPNKDLKRDNYHYNTQSVQEEILYREKNFFNTLANNPQLSEQHPLYHLIVAQERKNLVNKQSGLLKPIKDPHNVHTYSRDKTVTTAPEPHSVNINSRFASYTTEIPYTINGQVVLPSEHRSRQSKSRRLARTAPGTSSAPSLHDTSSKTDKLSNQGLLKEAKEAADSFKSFLKDSLKNLDKNNQNMATDLKRLEKTVTVENSSSETKSNPNHQNDLDLDDEEQEAENVSYEEQSLEQPSLHIDLQNESSIIKFDDAPIIDLNQPSHVMEVQGEDEDEDSQVLSLDQLRQHQSNNVTA